MFTIHSYTLHLTPSGILNVDETWSIVFLGYQKPTQQLSTTFEYYYYLLPMSFSEGLSPDNTKEYIGKFAKGSNIIGMLLKVVG